MRDLIPHIGLIPKVIPLELFLDIVPSSPADVNARCVDVPACFFFSGVEAESLDFHDS